MTCSENTADDNSDTPEIIDHRLALAIADGSGLVNKIVLLQIDNLLILNVIKSVRFCTFLFVFIQGWDTLKLFRTF